MGKKKVNDVTERQGVADLIWEGMRTGKPLDIDYDKRRDEFLLFQDVYEEIMAYIQLNRTPKEFQSAGSYGHRNGLNRII